MPDIWTLRPELFRRELERAGLPCGGEARVFTSRDAEWTCYADGEGWIGDIYIHHLLDGNVVAGFSALVFILGVAIGYVVAKREANTRMQSECT